MAPDHRHNAMIGSARLAGFLAFLVALPDVPDLFICAKHLFFAPMVTTDGRWELRRGIFARRPHLAWYGLSNAQLTQPSRRTEFQKAWLALGSLRRSLCQPIEGARQLFWTARPGRDGYSFIFWAWCSRAAWNAARWCLGFVIVAIRWVFVDPSPELFSARAHVRRWCDQVVEERVTALLVILKTGVGRNEYHGQCLHVPLGRCVRSYRKLALQHLALGRRSTQQVQTNRVKCDVVDSKLRFNCVSTRHKAGQMTSLLLRLLQEVRQCLARTLVRCERTIGYCPMRRCKETITSRRGVSDATRASWDQDSGGVWCSRL